MTLEDALAAATRAMDVAETPEAVLEVAVGWATTLVPGCEMAGVTLRRRRGRLESMAPSNPAVAESDALQHELREGPCVDAVTDAPVIASDDAARDQRWPRWGPAVAERFGFHAMLSVRLASNDRVHGALNLYALEPDAFDAYAVDVATLLATHVSVALRSALAHEDLRLAVDSRLRIGQAQGILMERYSLDVARAFELLSRVSQQRNVRLIELADHVVEHRTLPGAVPS